MHLSPRLTFFAALVAILVVGFAIIGSWLVSGHDWVAYLVFVWAFAGTWILSQVRCPRCHSPVAYEAQIGKVNVITAFARKTCGECGYDFTR